MYKYWEGLKKEVEEQYVKCTTAAAVVGSGNYMDRTLADQSLSTVRTL